MKNLKKKKIFLFKKKKKKEKFKFFPNTRLYFALDGRRWPRGTAIARTT